MQELDFSHCKTYPKAYNWANGKKIAILYKGELYMLKFATKLKENHTKDENFLKSLEKIANKINQKEINNIIENTPYISNNHKFFLKTMINARKTWLIDKALSKYIKKREQ